MENKFYEQIDKAIKEREAGKSYPSKSIEWICDRIDWCWKFRKISEKEMVELADRIVAVMDSGLASGGMYW